MKRRGIEDYAVIGDGRSAALISRAGAVEWLCWPRFDSGALFASILDPVRGGLWRVSPSGTFRSTRRYVPDTNVLVTAFETPDGAVTLTDAMSIATEEHKRAHSMPDHELLRIARCERGSVELDVRFEPRPDFGRRPGVVIDRGALGLRLELGRELYTLRSSRPLEVREGAVVGRIVLRAGEELRLSLCHDCEAPAVLPPLEQSPERMERTAQWWRQWASRIQVTGPWRETIVRSALVLKLLIFAPSGALIAAPTTSLPERIGGDLNWDYRFCWLRDAAFTVRVLLDLGYREDAEAFVGWLLHSTRLTRPALSVLYDVHGRLPAEELVIEGLDGFLGSAPVRVNNAASTQLQLDVYGEVIDAAAQLYLRDGAPDGDTQVMLRDFGRFVCEHWREPDRGLWEPRTPPRHHTHSKVACWVALDRLLRLESAGKLEKLDRPRLEQERTEIAAEIDRRGWNGKYYTRTFGDAEADASALLMSLYDYLPPEHPRMRSTYRAVRSVLDAGPGLIHRNTVSREAGEGAFGICSAWVAEYLARGGGSLAEATSYLQTFAAYGNDLGLFAEEIDPRTGALLGNFPQAFTHLGLICAALSLIERARTEVPAVVRQELRP